MNQEIIIDCEVIKTHKLSWNETRRLFKIKDEGTYARYFIHLYGLEIVDKFFTYPDVSPF